MNLRPSLFWDTDYASINWEHHAKYVIERVLHRGTWEEFKSMLVFYGRERITAVIKRLRYMDKRVMHFCRVYFNIPLNEMRCYNIKQSKIVHWDY